MFRYGNKKTSYDNCPLISNSNQIDTNSNLIGDACEYINNGSSLSIQSNVIEEST
jgi:hypothetical protein